MIVFTHQAGAGKTQYLLIPKAICDLVSIGKNNAFDMSVKAGRLVITQLDADLSSAAAVDATEDKESKELAKAAAVRNSRRRIKK